MTVAAKHYQKEVKRFGRYSRWWFKNSTEATQAIEYVCRHWGVPNVLVEYRSGPGTFGGHYQVQMALRGMKHPEIMLYRDELNLRLVAHELAHHLDAEEMIAVGKWIRGWPRSFHRWHRDHHLDLMGAVIDVLERKYGKRTPRSCAGPRRTVKVRS